MGQTGRRTEFPDRYRWSVGYADVRRKTPPKFNGFDYG